MNGNAPMRAVDDNVYAPAPVTPIRQTSIEDAETVEETLSLEDVEKEMICKALERHNGRRKNAASDLQISERTLYRKIKEYGLE
jgi:DNA-binding NtrC family response regulator